MWYPYHSTALRFKLLLFFVFFSASFPFDLFLWYMKSLRRQSGLRNIYAKYVMRKNLSREPQITGIFINKIASSIAVIWFQAKFSELCWDIQICINWKINHSVGWNRLNIKLFYQHFKKILSATFHNCSSFLVLALGNAWEIIFESESDFNRS